MTTPAPSTWRTSTSSGGPSAWSTCVGAWNNQLLEVMGAMGMREVRRLRGEVGRIMFKEDLDKEIFAPALRPAGGREPARGRVGAHLCVRPEWADHLGPPLRKDGQAQRPAPPVIKIETTQLKKTDHMALTEENRS